MVLSWHEDVIGEFGHLRDALADRPSNWMPATVEDDRTKVAELKADTPFGQLSRYARIETGLPQVLDDQVIVPIRWASLESEDLFPIFYGELRLKQGDDGRSRLELHGHYEPPAGAAGKAADAVVMKAIAEATVEDFVHRVAGILSRDALGRSVAEEVEAGRLTLDG